MKLPETARQFIASAIAPFDTEANRAAYRGGDFPRADRVKDIDKRYRWDLLNAGVHPSIICDWYERYNVTDVHIDTALRSLVAPL